MINIRKEKRKDYDAVRFVNDQAFGQLEEGRIVDKIRAVCEDVLSLVALWSEDNFAIASNKVVGHIFFSPAIIDYGDNQINGMGLGPMAVLPEHQKQGIGALLVNRGVQFIQETECPFIVVLGHEHYYPRFGFERASKYGLKAQWEGVPDEAFMAMVLNKAMLENVSGVVRYRSEFDEAM